MKIALSGATGLIGAALAARLSRSHTVSCVGRTPGADLHVDFQKPEGLAALDLDGFGAFVHCAGVTDTDFAEDRVAAYIQSTSAVAELVERAKTARVKRFVYVSTAHIYGPFVGRIDENSVPHPIGDYAIAHYAAEQIVRREASANFSTLILRPCAVFGLPLRMDRFDRWSLIPYSFPLEAVTKQSITLRSRGDQRRNFIATIDIAEAIVRFIEAPSVDSRVMNPIGPDLISVWDFAQECARAYKCVTNEVCSIVRPAESDPDPGCTFDFQSLHPDSYWPTHIGSYVPEMIATLVEKAREGWSHGT